MIFNPTKGGVIYSKFLTPPNPPQPPPPPFKNSKKWVSSGGGSWGVRTKNSLGDAFIGQNNDFTKG